ncbi:MAG: AAA-like domain-containing protein [Candidatus Magnetomorum sp.]|nr:AAA-like domain-containing protein [Candidatus Magnetomorum sp.]
MRTFSSYGPIHIKKHYYAPRKELIKQAADQLMGDEEGGHYITIWAPRQSGKTWVMQQVVRHIQERGDFDVAIISLQRAKDLSSDDGVLSVFVNKLQTHFQRDFISLSDWRSYSTVLLKKLFKFDSVNTIQWQQFTHIFTKKFFKKPVILIIDEFDALEENFINKFVNEFRDMYISRQAESNEISSEKNGLLHGLALIGVRSALGIENIKGSPFNVQRSIHIPNLTYDEVNGMFKWYEKESNQQIDQDVIDRIYYEFQGQPGLTCWFGEQLTEHYNTETDKAISRSHFDHVLMIASTALPNNTILNIISKAKSSPYQEVVLELFKTDIKVEFSFDDTILNYLYMNGVIDLEHEKDQPIYVKFASPFVQKRLFNYFSRELFKYPGQLIEPFSRIDHVINDHRIHIKNLMHLYETYLKKNKSWLLENAPRRKDLRIFEAVYHFNLYMFLHQFLTPRKAKVWPEFPTGNGKIDIMINYANEIYGIELKTFSDESTYKEAIKQAAKYAVKLKTNVIALVFFVEFIDDKSREDYEKVNRDKTTGISVETIFIESGKADENMNVYS